MLYIGDNYNDFTAPHYWSPAFSINPNAGVDNGANPGDGSALAESLTLAKSTTSTGYGAAGPDHPLHLPGDQHRERHADRRLGHRQQEHRQLPLAAPSTPAPTRPAPGTYTITAADMTAGSVTNVATASATGPGPVSSASSQVTLTTSGPADGSVIPGAAAHQSAPSPPQSVLERPADQRRHPGELRPPPPRKRQHPRVQRTQRRSADLAQRLRRRDHPGSVDPPELGRIGRTCRPRPTPSYTLYALPNFGTLGETSGPACNFRASASCTSVTTRATSPPRTTGPSPSTSTRTGGRQRGEPG